MAQRLFNHEKLVVYQEALAFVADAEVMLSNWDGTHAVTDHLSRASESIIVNLAEACRAHGLSAKQRGLDYSLGSALECAACLDIAQIKGLLDDGPLRVHKQRLCRTAGMLIRLRESWGSSLHEDAGPYGDDMSRSRATVAFHHERLDMYRVALDFMRWLSADGRTQALPPRLLRRIDQAATSLILNVAEGNGRFSQLDRCRFLDIANGAAIRAAAYLDVCVHRGVLLAGDIAGAKELLVRAGSMTAALGLRAGEQSDGVHDKVHDEVEG